MSETLATSLIIQTEDGVMRRNDVKVTISDRPRRRETLITLDTQGGTLVDIILSGAERIALIEALGGKAWPHEAAYVRWLDEDGAQVGADAR